MPLLNPSNEKNRRITWDPATQLHPRQLQCFDLLAHPESQHHILLYGGSVGSGKSYLIAYFFLWSAMTYAETKYFVCRKRLDQLITSTVGAIIKLAGELGIPLIHNKNEKLLTLENGSTIQYSGIDLAADPLLEGLGSNDYTACAIEEAAELDFIVQRRLTTRLRYGLTEHQIRGKLLLTCNPNRSSYLYREWYLPSVAGTLPPSWKFIKALPTDNPTSMAIPGYYESLTVESGNMTEAEFQCLVLGSWEYAEDDGELVAMSDLEDCHNWSDEGIERKEKFLSADIGGGGANADRTVIGIWDGMCLIDCIIMRSKDTVQVAQAIREQIQKHSISMRNCIIDVNNLGQGVADQLGKGLVQFKAHQSPFNNESFALLKDQLYFRLMEVIARKQIRFKVPAIKDQLIEEIMAHKRANPLSDGKQKVSDKKTVSRAINRSPDLADMAMQRMYFLYRKKSYTIQVHDFGGRAA